MLQQQAEYWKGAPALLELSWDHARPVQPGMSSLPLHTLHTNSGPRRLRLWNSMPPNVREDWLNQSFRTQSGPDLEAKNIEVPSAYGSCRNGYIRANPSLSEQF